MLDEMKEKFGEEETENYLVLTRALRALIYAFGSYQQAEDNSFEETLARAQVEKMLEDCRMNPDKGVDLLEAAVALIVGTIGGISAEEWFGRVGIELFPEESPE